MRKALILFILLAAVRLSGQVTPTGSNSAAANASKSKLAQPSGQVTDKQLAEFWRLQAELLQAQVAVWKTKAEALEAAAMDGPRKRMNDAFNAVKQACGGQLGADENGNPVCPTPAATATPSATPATR